MPKIADLTDKQKKQLKDIEQRGHYNWPSSVHEYLKVFDDSYRWEVNNMDDTPSQCWVRINGRQQSFNQWDQVWPWIRSTMKELDELDEAVKRAKEIEKMQEKVSFNKLFEPE